MTHIFFILRLAAYFFYRFKSPYQLRYLFAFLTMSFQGYSQRQSKDIAVAQAHFDVGEYAKAKEYYCIVYAQKHDIVVARSIARCSYLIRDYQQAEAWYNRIYKSKSYDTADITAYCEILKMNEKYNLAREIVNNFLDSTLIQETARIILRSCDSSLKWMSHKEVLSIIPLKGINTEYSEISPAFYKNGIVYNSTMEKKILKKKAGLTDEPFYDLYFGWGDSNDHWHSTIFSVFLNSSDHEGSVTFNKAFDQIYLTRCRSNLTRQDSVGTNHLKLYKAHKLGLGWSKPEQFMINDSVYSFGHPSISADEKIFFFSSNMPGGLGGVDIYACFKVDSLRWSLPVNLGPQINSSYNELFPFIHTDGRLFFSSDNPSGMGGYDIYYSVVVNDTWNIPVNMKYPINSSQDDFSFILDEEKTTGYLTSNRKGGKGKEDIYRIKYNTDLRKP